MDYGAKNASNPPNIISMVCYEIFIAEFFPLLQGAISYSQFLAFVSSGSIAPQISATFDKSAPIAELKLAHRKFAPARFAPVKSAL